MTLRSLATTCLILLAMASPSLAKDAAAVLMVEDNEITEKIGIAAYAPFLVQSGAYKKVYTLHGRQRSNERLASAIRQAAADHDYVDVVVSVHTTARDPQLMQRLVPQSARKLRLVYSTACYGADVEREAWEQLGAHTVVTHVGINNPLVALPYFLSEWIRGEPVEKTIREGFREEAITSRFGLSLPGVGEAMSVLYGDNGGNPAFLTGSRPVLSGNGGLTIRSGLGRVRLKKPAHLRYSRSKGGSLGLATRAMAGRYDLKGESLAHALGMLRVPATPWLPPNLLRRLRVKPVYRTRNTGHHRGSSFHSRRELRAGKIEISLAKKQEIPLEQGLKMKVNKVVTITPGRLDPEKRTLRLEVSGLWIKKGALSYRLTSMTVKPDDYGYKVTVGGGVFGFIPYWHSIPIGGRNPEPLPADLSILSARSHEAKRGIADTIGLAPTQR